MNAKYVAYIPNLLVTHILMVKIANGASNKSRFWAFAFALNFSTLHSGAKGFLFDATNLGD